MNDKTVEFLAAAPNPNGNKSLPPQTSPVRGEIALPYGPRSLSYQFVQKDGQLWNPDQTLQLEVGGDLRGYTDLLRDGHVQATFDQRRSSVTAASWTVEPGDQSPIALEAADFVTDNLNRIDFDKVTDSMLYGRFYGYAVAEILWQIGDGKFEWAAVKVRDRARFLFQGDGRCYLNMGGAVSDVAGRIYCDSTDENPYFWIISCGEDHGDNPYGRGLAQQLWWPVRFKRDVLRWWMIYNEKFAQPTAVGTFPSGSNESSLLLAACKAILTDNAVVIPENMKIELLEAARSGSADYKTFAEYVDQEISKVLVGQTLTTQVGNAGGNRALGQVHAGVKAELIKSDADLICESLNNGPIRWLVQRNFGMDCPLPRVKRDTEQSVDLTALATQLVQLDTMGFRPNLEMIIESWGAEFEDNGQPVVAPSPFNPAAPMDPNAPAPKPGEPPKPKPGKPGAFGSPEFAAALPKLFPDQTALDGSLELLGRRMASVSADALRGFLDYTASHTPAQVLEVATHALPGWDPTQLNDAVAQVLFVSKTFGRAYADLD